MANFTVVSTDGFDMYDPALYGVATALPGDITQFGWISPDGTFWLATGTGFTYGPDGLPTGGTITGLTAMVGGNVIAQATDLDVDANTLMHSGMSDFYNTLFPGSDTDIMQFGAGNDRIFSTAGDDYINAGGGSDTFTWNEGDGSDWFNGGTGELDMAKVNVTGNWHVESQSGHGANIHDLDDANNDDLQLQDVEILKVSTVGSTESNTVTFGQYLEDDFNGIVFEGGDTDDTVNFNKTLELETYVDTGAGDDRVFGAKGDDTVFGGDGDDQINGRKGNDTIDGGAGDDRLDGDLGDDTIDGGAGDDVINWDVREGNDVIDGGDGDDVFTVGSIFDTAAHVSAQGDDVLIASNADYKTATLSNIETIEFKRSYGNVDVTVGDLSGSTMEDSRIILHDGDGDTFFDGHQTSNAMTFIRDERGSGQSNDFDVFLGGASNDDLLVINGSHAEADQWTLTDFFGGLAASDAQTGGFIFSRDIERVEMDLDNRNDTVDIDQSVSLNYKGTFKIDGGRGDDTLTTDAAVTNDITFDDEDGDDVATTGAGDDTFVYRNGYDSYNGRSGSDTVNFENFSSAVYLNLSAATFTSTVAWTRDSMDLNSGSWRILSDMTDIENMVGTQGSDYFVGGAEDNVYGYVGAEGSGGLDRVLANGGNDTIDFSRFDSAVQVDLGSAGTEARTRDGDDLSSGQWRDIAVLSGVENMVGTEGSDQFFGDAAENTYTYVGEKGSGGLDIFEGGARSDTIDFSRFDAAISVDLASSGAEVRTQDDEDLSTGQWRDIADLDSVENVVGTEYSDTFFGDGADNIYSYFGKMGSGGTDMAYGRGGTDTIDFSKFDSAVWVDLGISHGAEAWTRDTETVDSGTWRPIAYLDGFENITGTDFNDRLTGDDSANRIDGGAGNDRLFGDGGGDTFVYAEGGGHDEIVDFGTGDVIEINVDGFDTFSDITSSMSQDWDELVIDFGQGESLTLKGVTHFDIEESDFVFV